jgi:arabinogalactan endo-1,4-beta-galactosidase
MIQPIADVHPASASLRSIESCEVSTPVCLRFASKTDRERANTILKKISKNKVLFDIIRSLSHHPQKANAFS